MTRVRNYERRRYKSLDQRLVNHLESRIIERYLDELCLPGGSILDIPCGYGRFVPVLRQRAATVVGGDRKLAMLQRMRERFEQEVGVVQMLSSALPFTDDSFDVVTCIRLMQHIHAADDRWATYAEIARVASRGAVVTVYLDTFAHRFVHRARRLKRLTRDRLDELEARLPALGLRLRNHARILPGLHAQMVLQLETCKPAQSR